MNFLRTTSLLFAALALSACAVNPVPTPATASDRANIATDVGAAGHDSSADADLQGSGSDTGTAAESDTATGAETSTGNDTGTGADTDGDPDTHGDTSTTLDAAEPDTAAPDAANIDTASADIASTDAFTPFVFSSLEIGQQWGPCPPSVPCSNWWTLFYDGSVDLIKKSVKSKTTVSVTDLVAMQKILASAAFQQGIKTGFACDPPPTDISVHMKLKVSGVSHQQNVTGCVMSGPKGNAADKLFKILTKY
jgi:hypothetical protein